MYDKLQRQFLNPIDRLSHLYDKSDLVSRQIIAHGDKAGPNKETMTKMAGDDKVHFSERCRIKAGLGLQVIVSCHCTDRLFPSNSSGVSSMPPSRSSTARLPSIPTRPICTLLHQTLHSTLALAKKPSHFPLSIDIQHLHLLITNHPPVLAY